MKSNSINLLQDLGITKESTEKKKGKEDWKKEVCTTDFFPSKDDEYKNIYLTIRTAVTRIISNFVFLVYLNY